MKSIVKKFFCELGQGSQLLIGLLAFFMSEAVLAANAATTISGMVNNVTSAFGYLFKLITAASFMAGTGFAVGAVMKFKQHKDNPTQVPVGTPIALVFIAAALLSLPTILNIAGNTVLGTTGMGPTGSMYGGS